LDDDIFLSQKTVKKIQPPSYGAKWWLVTFQVPPFRNQKPNFVDATGFFWRKQ